MQEYLQPIPLQTILGDATYKKGQYGNEIDCYATQFPQWENASIILVGVNEERGKGITQQQDDTTAIRKQLYNLYCWHTELKICDIGNIINGKKLTDTYAALQQVLSELQAANKTVIILGNSHDITTPQYQSFVINQQQIEATCIDACMDLSMESIFANDNFLLPMLTGEPNYIRHYNHVGFQSYFVHPTMMDTLNTLRFDCYRVGKVREHLAEYEPIFRNSNMVSIDVNALQHSVMPCNTLTPNGFAGDEACTLAKYAGMSTALQSIGIYNYKNANDVHQLGATQIAQMIWYFIDGRNTLLHENAITQLQYYKEYTTAFSDISITFYQNIKTKRWWMQLPNHTYTACSYNDYLLASNNEIPERWLRTQERNL